MNPFLVEIAHKQDGYQSREEIMRIMDELEDLFEALEEDQQDACSHMMSLLEKRLTALDGRCASTFAFEFRIASIVVMS
jgi:hypothetical protein